MTSLRSRIPAALLVVVAPVLAQDKRAMTFEDVMKFRRISAPVIADTGAAVAYVAAPDRGNGEVLVHDLERDRVHRIERGSGPRFSKDGRWVGALVQPPAFAEGEEEPRTGFVLLDLQSGLVVHWDDVRAFAFADDSRYLAIQEHAPKAEEDGPKSDRTVGTPLRLRRLDADRTLELTSDHVTSIAFHPKGDSLLCAVAEPEGRGNGLFAWDLDDEDPRFRSVLPGSGAVVTDMAWTEAGDAFAVVRAPEDDDGIQGPGAVFVVEGEDVRPAAFASSRGSAWTLPSKPGLRWAEDGSWLAFGFQPTAMADRLRELAAEKERSGSAEEDDRDADPYDLDAILEEREVDVWHWEDPLINPNQKEMWARISGKTYTAVWHRDEARLVPLCDEEMPDVELLEESAVALGSSNVPYRQEITWDGRYRDVYLVDIETGGRAKILERHGGPAELSPDGRQVVFWREGDWHHLPSEDPQAVSRLTRGGFANEDHDYPSDVPGYGLAGWLEDGAFLIYDKYDIWRFEPPAIGRYVEAGFKTADSERTAPTCLTVGPEGRTGRQSERVFRILDLDREARYLDPTEPWLLSSYHDRRKNHGFWRWMPGKGVRRLLEDAKKFDLVTKAENAERILYTRESYTEFPDLWVAGTDLRQPQKVSDLGRQTEDYAWGTAELVEWRSLDGTPLQGALIKPGNYREGERYPVLVYYYRFFSQRLHEFNAVVVNHRPCFPFYASNGYAVFLPDIRFDVGYPGYSATKCLVPGVQKLIDMGVADPDAIALHGHSWSGYQTAHVITQTDAFCCAVAGAPVSNMTSAYGGIRWGTGLSRQFQYEKSQSRIGGSLWEYPERYIENSPLFFADRIETPLLIQFGDEDGAVPWYQGIELYMAMRRLDKECVFLQYRGEPHHLRKYANKLDYSMKFRQWLDHYCKGMPAPKWISEGVPYSGR